MEPITILYSLLGILVTAALAYWAATARDKSNKQTEELTKAVRDIEQLKATAVTEPRVREILKEALAPMSQDIKEAKVSLLKINETLQNIQIDIATENAFKRGKSSQAKEE